MMGKCLGVQMVRAAPRRLLRKGGEMGGEVSSMEKLCVRLQRCFTSSSRRQATLTSRAAVFTSGLALPMMCCMTSYSCPC
jgi:hypothetical protein